MNPDPKYQHLAAFKWKQGQSGNLQGRPKSHLTVLKELGYTKPVIATLVAEMLFMPYDKVLAINESKTEPAIRRVIATAIVRSCGYRGDYKYLASFMNILFGCSIPYTSKESLEQDKPEE